MDLCIDHLHDGGLIVNYRCTACCGHCLYACSPRRDAGYMDAVTTRRIASTLRARGCHSVHIGGGEPFLSIDGLCTVLDVLTDAQINVAYVETNCSWAVDACRAEQALAPLRDHGLSMILVSIDPFHNAAVPFERVAFAARAADRLGIGVFPWQMEFRPDVGHFDPSKTHTMAEYIAAYGDDYPARILQRYGMTIGGRAAYTFAPYMPRRAVEDIISQPSPCARLADTSHFHVDLYGSYVPSLCTGLQIDIDQIGQPLPPSSLLATLYRDGIHALYTRAVSEHHFQPDPTGYTHACHLCLAIRQHIAAVNDAPPAELGPAGFYKALASHT